MTGTAQIEQIEQRLKAFDTMPDAEFIGAVLKHSRYLDNQSRANAREAVRRLDRLLKERGELMKLVALADKAIYAKEDGEMFICDACAEEYFNARALLAKCGATK